jgi:hypothetical protein
MSTHEFSMRTWYIVHANCDCSSETYARTSRPGRGMWGGIRCRMCGHIMGPIEWDLQGKVRARTEYEAIQKWYGSQKQKAGDA